MDDMGAWNVNVIGSTGVGGLIEDVANNSLIVPALTFCSGFVKYNCWGKEGDSISEIRRLMVHKLEGGGSTVGVSKRSTVYGIYSVSTG